MRPKDSANFAISSLPDSWNSGTSMFPRLTSLASLDNLFTGRATKKMSMALRARKIPAKTTAKESMNPAKAIFARWIGNCMGADTICAVRMSFNFQPKPLSLP